MVLAVATLVAVIAIATDDAPDDPAPGCAGIDANGVLDTWRADIIGRVTHPNPSVFVTVAAGVGTVVDERDGDSYGPSWQTEECLEQAEPGVTCPVPSEDGVTVVAVDGVLDEVELVYGSGPIVLDGYRAEFRHPDGTVERARPGDIGDRFLFVTQQNDDEDETQMLPIVDGRVVAEGGPPGSLRRQLHGATEDEALTILRGVIR